MHADQPRRQNHKIRHRRSVKLNQGLTENVKWVADGHAMLIIAFLLTLINSSEVEIHDVKPQDASVFERLLYDETSMKA